MGKTKEELNQIKAECETLVEKLKELSDEELNMVTGGSTIEDAPDELSCGKWKFVGFVGKYADSHIGEKLYLVSHDKDEYYYGRLLDSFEAESTFWTERTQVILCEEHNGAVFKGYVEVSGDDYWLYRERIK